jgi:hypothetical protein
MQVGVQKCRGITREIEIEEVEMTHEEASVYAYMDRETCIEMFGRCQNYTSYALEESYDIRRSRTDCDTYKTWW